MSGSKMKRGPISTKRTSESSVPNAVKNTSKHNYDIVQNDIVDILGSMIHYRGRG